MAIIDPANKNIFVNKYGIDSSEIEPLAVIYALHKRIVDVEKNYISLKNALNDLIVEIEMIKESDHGHS